jgi:hypothetical protein
LRPEITYIIKPYQQHREVTAPRHKKVVTVIQR